MTKLRVVPCLVQDVKARYPNEEDIAAVPKVASWRNNLTALSQYQNLLFVAYLDKIHVFKPQFPAQYLKERPDLIINLPKSRSDLQGYLDPTSGHCINHLIIGDLGNEEIVLAACDDGDVISYTIQSVSLAVEQAASLADPWFLQNVGKSAWGLAIHKEARLLAVSSNTHATDVFAPALKGSELSRRAHFKENALVGSVDPAMWELPFERWIPQFSATPGIRDHNAKICLNAHTTNIPNIAFCNTECDREGRYLASTDIDNNTFIWDIYKGTTLFRYNGNLTQRQRGWGVACLDPCTSRLTNDPTATFGCCFANTNDEKTLIDASEGGRCVPDNSHWHPGFSAFGGVPSTSAVDAILAIEQDADVESDSMVMSLQQEEEASENVDPGNDDEAELALTLEFDAMDAGLHPPSDDDLGDAFHSDDSEELAAVMNEAFLEYASGEQAQDPAVTTSDAEPMLHTPILLNQMMMYHSTGRKANSPHKTSDDSEKPADQVPPRNTSTTGCLPFNLLQTSELDIHLLSGIVFDPHVRIQKTKSRYVRVICQQALHQTMPPGLHHLGHIERLNMIVQIPELGVIAIGNQTGRVGVLSATRWEKVQQSGYRIECILPFRSQEEKGVRPQKPLMGVAVGPIQGQENQPEPGSALDISQDCTTGLRSTQKSSRRYRLLVVYSDHTVLSYEISRTLENDITII